MTELQHRMGADPAELAVVRRRVRAWAQVAGLSPARLDRLLLALGEALSNAVEHAYRGRGAGVVDVFVDLDGDGRLVGRVRDYGCWREPDAMPPDAVRPRGRGIGLIRGLMDQVELVHGQDGTTVQFTDAGLAHPLWGPEPPVDAQR